MHCASMLSPFCMFQSCAENVFCLCMQVLPSSMMLLADPSPDSILAALESALQRLPDLKPFEQHDRVQCSPLQQAKCSEAAFLCHL